MIVSTLTHTPPKKPSNGCRRNTRIVLGSMDDPHAPPPGTKGTVAYVDDMGLIGMNWDNGSSLSLMPSLDSFSKEPELKREKKRSKGLER